MFSELDRFAQFVPQTPPQTLADLPNDLQMYADGKVEVWYSPMPTERKNPKLWILGITPGWAQMRIAYEQAAIALNEGANPAEAVARPKPSVAFAGSMRTNLVAMLDDLGMPGFLGADTLGELFGSKDLKTGSALRYPVFKNRANYNGHSPNPLRHPALRTMLDQLLAQEIENTGNCLILPLGRSVEAMLAYAVDEQMLSPARILTGFPHPSGANGHRKTQYKQRKADLRVQITKWFDSNS